MPDGDRGVIAPDALGVLVDALRNRGSRVLGPNVTDGAIVYSAAELIAEQVAGSAPAASS